MKTIRMLGGWLVAFAVLTTAAGCPGTGGPVVGDFQKGKGDDGHQHAGEGPHHGVLVGWGEEEYHLEFSADRANQDVTVYILGMDGKTPAPIKTEIIQLVGKDPAFQTDLRASPQEGDPAGTASRFVGKLPETTTGRKLSGTISGEVNGKAYSGDFKEGHGHTHTK